MRIEKEIFVILTPGFARDEAETTCMPMQQSFVLLLKELYPQLDIIILTFQYPYHKKKYRWFGVDIIPFSGRNKGGWVRFSLRKKINSTLKNINRKNKIAGLLSFWCNECAWVGKHFGEKYGIKHYCWVLGQDATKNNRYPRKLQPGSEELVALSDFLQDEFERNHGIRPLHVIPPGINLNQFQKPPLTKDIDILAAGSLIPLKQYDVFLEVVSAIKNKLPSAKAVLIGDGPERIKLQGLINKLDLQSNISLLGELPHTEVLQWMQRAKTFLHTSSYEGFGVVCIEALHAGAHVASFVKPMHTDIQNWHIAINKEDMIQKILDILKDPGSEYTGATPFLLEDSVNMMMKLYAS